GVHDPAVGGCDHDARVDLLPQVGEPGGVTEERRHAGAERAEAPGEPGASTQGVDDRRDGRGHGEWGSILVDLHDSTLAPGARDGRVSMLTRPLERAAVSGGSRAPHAASRTTARTRRTTAAGPAPSPGSGSERRCPWARAAARGPWGSAAPAPGPAG